MNLSINGELREVNGVCHVADLITALNLPAPAILVEHNGLALRREEWANSPVKDQDQLEIIRIVAGG